MVYIVSFSAPYFSTLAGRLSHPDAFLVLSDSRTFLTCTWKTGLDLIIGSELFAICICKTLGWLFKSVSEEFLNLTSPISLLSILCDFSQFEFRKELGHTYYINILMTTFLTIFRRFPTTFRKFPKIFQNCPPNIFSDIFRR